MQPVALQAVALQAAARGMCNLGAMQCRCMSHRPCCTQTILACTQIKPKCPDGFCCNTGLPCSPKSPQSSPTYNAL